MARRHRRRGGSDPGGQLSGQLGAPSGHPALAADRLAPPTAGQLRRLLIGQHLRPRRSLSQNFLTDADALDAIVAAAELRAGEAVVEVGPGLGVLTRRLLAAGCRVRAVELDRGLAGYLRRELDGVEEFELVESDALELDPASCFPGEPFKLVANIPYHITSPLLHHFLEGDRPPDLAVLLVQREVAERIAAPPGAMSYLSVFVQHVAEAELVTVVPASAFEPAPKVDSAVLRLRRRPQPPLPPGLRDPFYRLVQAAFRQRRKQLHNALARELPIPPAELGVAFESCGVAPDRRAQTLSVGEWVCLADRLAARLGGRADAGGERRA